MEGEAKGKTYKMKGHTLPGINQRLDANATNVAEQGLAGSSAFQQGMTGMMGAAQALQQRRNPVPPVGGVGAMGGMGAGMGMGMTPPLVSKPSVAKDMKTGKYKQKFENNI